MNILVVYLIGSISTAIILIVSFVFALRATLMFKQQRDPVNALKPGRKVKTFADEKTEDKRVQDYLDTLA